MWNYGFAVNKKLWTSSYVLLTVGIDCCLLAIVAYYTDLKQRKRGVYFFQVFGKNTLAIYLLSELLVILLYMAPAGDTSLFRWIFVHVFKPVGDYSGAFLFAIAYMLTCWSVGCVMDKKKIYIKI
jgi:predicted acyltransferase